MDIVRPTIYLIPRWAGNCHSDWYDWLSDSLKSEFDIKIQRLEMPDWNQPEIDEAIQFLDKQVSVLNESIFFIGHSVGCQAVLQYLYNRFTSNHDIKIGGFLFVAGWFAVDHPWEALKPWLGFDKINLDVLSTNIDYKKVLISDNDPFTSDFNHNKTLWETRIGAKVDVLHGKLHFNKAIENEVKSEILAMIDQYLKRTELIENL